MFLINCESTTRCIPPALADVDGCRYASDLDFYFRLFIFKSIFEFLLRFSLNLISNLICYLVFSFWAQIRPSNIPKGRREMDNDIFIAVMGATGAGKSSFVKLVTGIDDVQVGHDLTSSMSEAIERKVHSLTSTSDYGHQCVPSLLWRKTFQHYRHTRL
jgi:hypothetical protein